MNSPNIIKDVRRRWAIGESVEGGIIGEYRSEEYRQYKMFLNPSAKGNVDLTLTGSLGENITVKQQAADAFLIYSTDEKYQKIGKKYGFDEFGLSDEEWYIMSQEVLALALDHVMNLAYE